MRKWIEIMGKMKKAGSLVLICLLILQLAAGALSTARSDEPIAAPDVDSVETSAEQTESKPEKLQTPDSGEADLSSAESPLTEPVTENDPADTTDEIQLGGYEGMHTDSDEDLTAPIPSQTGEEDPDVPVTDEITADVPATAAPETVPVITEPTEPDPADLLPVEAPAAAPASSEGQGGLYDIADPDPNYSYKVVKVTGSDRDLLERLVMGEAGDQGYIGAAMVAQCIKDAMTYQGYKTVAEVRSKMKYSGSVSRKPNSDVIKAVAYIFDEGGYAVQHPMLYFYYSRNGIKKGFHETQEFVVQYKDHRFFWKKK